MDLLCDASLYEYKKMCSLLGYHGARIDTCIVSKQRVVSMWAFIMTRASSPPPLFKSQQTACDVSTHSL